VISSLPWVRVREPAPHPGPAAIIGEGVETERQHAELLALGVDFGQGYRFGKPAPAKTWRVGLPGPLRRLVRTE
jgi:hypothetical protein